MKSNKLNTLSSPKVLYLRTHANTLSPQVLQSLRRPWQGGCKYWRSGATVPRIFSVTVFSSSEGAEAWGVLHAFRPWSSLCSRFGKQLPVCSMCKVRLSGWGSINNMVPLLDMLFGIPCWPLNDYWQWTHTLIQIRCWTRREFFRTSILYRFNSGLSSRQQAWCSVSHAAVFPS